MWLASVLVGAVPLAVAAKAMLLDRRLRWIPIVAIGTVFLYLAYGLFLNRHNPLGSTLLFLLVLGLIPFSPPIVIICTAIVGVIYFLKAKRLRNSNAPLLSILAFASSGLMVCFCIGLRHLLIPFPKPDFSGI